jgi:hypothetical protein
MKGIEPVSVRAFPLAHMLLPMIIQSGHWLAQHTAHVERFTPRGTTPVALIVSQGVCFFHAGGACATKDTISGKGKRTSAGRYPASLEGDGMQASPHCAASISFGRNTPPSSELLLRSSEADMKKQHRLLRSSC